jgi:cell division protein FtsQ
MTAIKMNVAPVNGFAGLDDSEFVAVSPINVKPGVKLKAGFRMRPGTRDTAGEKAAAFPDAAAFLDAAASPDAAGSEEEVAMSGKREAAAFSRIQKVFRVLFLVCVTFFAGELIWLFLITPMRPLSLVMVTGIKSGLPEGDEARDEVLRAVGITAKTSYLSFDTRAAEKSLLTVPAIESAKVVKQFPGTVRITVVPRKSVALFLRNVNGKDAPVYFDKYGVVFKVGGKNEKEGILSVPVISGIETENGPVAEGERLSSVYIPLFENLDKLSSISPNLYQAISEIKINKKTYDGFDITLFPSQSPVKIRMNAELDEKKIGSAFLLLDVLEAKGVRVSEIDCRTGTASYIVKEANE